jgi:hypothetical protein
MKSNSKHMQTAVVMVALALIAAHYPVAGIALKADRHGRRLALATYVQKRHIRDHNSLTSRAEGESIMHASHFAKIRTSPSDGSQLW